MTKTTAATSTPPSKSHSVRGASCPSTIPVAGLASVDFLFGGFGNDTVFGGSGDDLVSGSVGNDQLFGGDGEDSIFAGPNSDRAEGVKVWT